MTVLIFDQPAAMADCLMQVWHETAADSISARGCMNVALSGGRTPAGVYQALARETGLSWKHTSIFQVDERFVPHDHADSNFHMIKETLLQGATIPADQVHPVQTDLATPEEAARAYDEELAQWFQVPAGEFPRFDLILLGLGQDGHTASLFPDSPILAPTTRLALPARLGGKSHDRVTLTMPVLNHARTILVLVQGPEKALALKGVLEDRDPLLPATLLAPMDGRLIFLADRAAAAFLSSRDISGEPS